MQVSEATIIQDVRVAFDENTKVTAFTDESGRTVDPDTLEMEDIIKSKIVDGVNAVRKAAPISMLEFTRKESGEDWPVTWIDENRCIGELALPDDYLRFILFKMSDWLHAVTGTISPGDDVYAQQFSGIKGVRGNPSRPVVAVSADTGTGKKTLQFFSCDSKEATAEFLYVPRFLGSTDTGEDAEGTVAYEIEQPIYRAVVLKIAALTAATYSSGDLMRLLNSLAQEEIS